MPQTVLTLISELRPDRVAAAGKLIEDLKAKVEALGHALPSGDPYEPVLTQIPDLHFASIMVFEDERFDPMLTVELNFDGPAGAFLPRLEIPLLAPHLRAILRCCKPPEDARLPMYEAATAQDARMPMAPYLETLIVRPALFHQGNRGLDRVRILREAKLYDDVQKALDAPALRTASDAGTLHRDLRAEVLADNAWLDETTPVRLPSGEHMLDLVRLIGFGLVAIAGLLLPGVLAWLILPGLADVAWVVLSIFVLATVVWAAKRQAARQPPPVVPQLPAVASQTPTFLLVGVPAALLLLVLCAVLPGFRAGLAGLVVIVAALAIWLRRLETTDKVHEKPRIDPTELREIMKLEDQISQNHMGSVVHVKPGVLRAVLIRLGLRGLGLLLRYRATDGYLADMRTIHFAHWALIDNGARLLFFSNFDSSWESYLDDFIEKAHAGLTLAWSNGLGFPRTKFLVEDGATNGPLFKTWARHSMARSLFWFSAYPDLSVNQVERNYAIATGLRARSLSGAKAARWACLL